MNYLKNLLAAKEKEYAEALEIIGKQEIQLERLDLHVPEFEVVNDP